MKRHLSVFMLYARSAVWRLLALLTAMGLAQTLLFLLALRGSADGSLEAVLRASRIHYVFGAAFLLLTALVCLPGCNFGAKPGYTLRRLCVSERAAFLWQSICNVCCYLILWAAELLLALLLCRIYSARRAELITGQTLFLAFYRSDFLHSLLPFEDALFWVRNGLLSLSLGVAAARFPFAQRRGQRGMEILVLACCAVFFFCREVGAQLSCCGCIFICLCGLASALCRTLEQEEAHEKV